MVGRIRDLASGGIRSAGKKDSRNEDRDANPMNDSIPGEVVRRSDRQKGERAGPSAKALAETDLQAVLAKGSGTREKWLKKALQQVQDGDLPAADLYNILKSPDFVNDLKDKTGRSMYRTMITRISVFSKGQQKFLSKECALAQMFGGGEAGAAVGNTSGPSATEEGENSEEMMARVRAFVRERNGLDLDQAAAAPVEPEPVPQPVPQLDPAAQALQALQLAAALPHLAGLPGMPGALPVPGALAVPAAGIGAPPLTVPAVGIGALPVALPAAAAVAAPPLVRQDMSAVAALMARASSAAVKSMEVPAEAPKLPAPEVAAEALSEVRAEAAKPEEKEEMDEEEEEEKEKKDAKAEKNEKSKKKASKKPRSASESSKPKGKKGRKGRRQSSSSSRPRRSPSKRRRRESSRSRSRDRRR